MFENQINSIERLEPSDIAEAVLYMRTQPRRVAVNKVLARPAAKPGKSTQYSYRKVAPIMSIISCDMREGRTEAQKRALSSGIIAAVQAASGEPISEMFFVIREGRGINFVEAGEHLPDYIEGNVNDADLIQHLHHQQ